VEGEKNFANARELKYMNVRENFEIRKHKVTVNDLKKKKSAV